MAGRTTYSDAKKAEVYVVLTANGGNIKRAARETLVPENTVRRWRDEWKKNGPPKTEEVEVAAGDFLEEATTTRDFALTTLKRKIPDAKPSELITIIGVLDDKIARARGLATHREEHVHTLNPSEEFKQLAADFLSEARELASRREEEIVDAELVEQAALPAGS